MMKKIVFLMSLALAGTSCASPHVEDTASMSDSQLARLLAVDGKSRLVQVDGAEVKSPLATSYYLKPGNRELQFQVHRKGAGAPGKGVKRMVPTDKYVTTRVNLQAGHDYLLKIDTRDQQPRVVIDERPSAARLSVADHN